MSPREAPKIKRCPVCGRHDLKIVNGKWPVHDYPGNGRCYKSGKPY